MGILSWIVFGLIAGALAKVFAPGDHPGGCIGTTLIGVVGALIGGFIATAFGAGGVSGFNIWSFAVAIGGAILLLVVMSVFARDE